MHKGLGQNGLRARVGVGLPLFLFEQKEDFRSRMERQSCLFLYGTKNIEPENVTTFFLML
jgi:hypothetical protein